MAEDKETYLDQLERWLNYEGELDPPRVADDVTAQRGQVVESVPRRRADSLVDGERPRVHLGNGKEGAPNNATYKCVDEAQKTARLEAQFPLPSSAREEADERVAGGAVSLGSNANNRTGVMHAVALKVKGVLGMKDALE